MSIDVLAVADELRAMASNGLLFTIDPYDRQRYERLLVIAAEMAAADSGLSAARFLEFTDYTRLSMKQETDLFFAHVLRADRPILDFLDADYTFLNQRLAEFYGIPGVKGHEFRKVTLAGSHRKVQFFFAIAEDFLAQRIGSK